MAEYSGKRVREIVTEAARGDVMEAILRLTEVRGKVSDELRVAIGEAAASRAEYNLLLITQRQRHMQAMEKLAASVEDLMEYVVGHQEEVGEESTNGHDEDDQHRP